LGHTYAEGCTFLIDQSLAEGKPVVALELAVRGFRLFPWEELLGERLVMLLARRGDMAGVQRVTAKALAEQKKLAVFL
jgi:hypothetical protein